MTKGPNKTTNAVGVPGIDSKDTYVSKNSSRRQVHPRRDGRLSAEAV